jgi:hypothetical protein
MRIITTRRRTGWVTTASASLVVNPVPDSADRDWKRAASWGHAGEHERARRHAGDHQRDDGDGEDACDGQHGDDLPEAAVGELPADLRAFATGSDRGPPKVPQSSTTRTCSRFPRLTAGS